MPVHPQAQAFLDSVAGAPPLDTQTPAQNRADQDEAKKIIGEPRPLPVVYDLTVAGVPTRVYAPRAIDATLGAVVYLHGGGWVLGDLDLADTTARDIAAAADAVVVSVDYRLAPENPFPAAVQDVLGVVTSLLEGTSGLAVDPTRITVAGDSAGGNLAAVAAQRLRDHEPPLVHQVLVYPVTDLREAPYPSYAEFADGYFLTARDMRYFVENYTVGHDVTDPMVSPALNPDLHGLAPATVITAEYDPVRDDGEAYAAALAASGVPVTTLRFAGMVHPFLFLAGMIDAATTARRIIGTEIGAVIGTSMQRR
ncbi:alpha/beta hydrolase [Corynebacterium sp. AOP40-9SA-29]|uniref:alpha/beta hydrolase n=1 Tax=Corynebacterium sp. AOP40-9SA-29 TaxID=3457677 RepID=UPI00403366DF